MVPNKQPLIDWEPAPSFVLIKPLKREELAALYNKGKSTLSLPDKMGKVSDSVGVGRVLLLGERVPNPAIRAALLPLTDSGTMTQHDADITLSWEFPSVDVGDLIAFMPYTDLLIEIDGIKYSLVEYKNIRAVKKGDQ